MYTLYSDKNHDFNCDIDIKGASLSETKVRLLLKSSDQTIVFEGNVDSAGNCEIPIKKLKRYFNQGDSGNAILEVIAEDTYFSPWQDTFTIEKEKDVVVEVKEGKNSKPLNESDVRVNVRSSNKKRTRKPITESDELLEMGSMDDSTLIYEMMSRKGVTSKVILRDLPTFKQFVQEYYESNNMNDSISLNKFMAEILKKFRQ